MDINVNVQIPDLIGAMESLAKALEPIFSIRPPQPPPPAALPAAPVVPVSPVSAAPVSPAPQYTHERIMAAGGALIDAGKMDDLIALLGRYGAQAVTQLKPDQLDTFAAELRALGATI